jgi:hypothetical protein
MVEISCIQEREEHPDAFGQERPGCLARLMLAHETANQSQSRACPLGMASTPVRMPVKGAYGTVRGHHEALASQEHEGLIPPASTIRVLYAFDPRRKGILLVGGDKRGSWNEWHDEHVPLADDLYDEHLAEIANEQKREGGR